MSGSTTGEWYLQITGMSLVALGLWMSLDEEGLRSVAQAIRSRELIDHVCCRICIVNYVHKLIICLFNFN
jgi:hypothetical protein